MTGIITFILKALAFMFVCILAAFGAGVVLAMMAPKKSPEEQYYDDWAQQEWIREWNRRKEDKDGPDPEDREPAE